MEVSMLSLESIQRVIDPLLPGLIGVRIVQVAPERVVSELVVRRDMCTVGGVLHSGAHVTLADTLGAIGTIMS
jgi:1,4-dihydroxy-2-naphthoyl-CoA hydrolase